MDATDDRIDEILERVTRMEGTLDQLARQRTAKEWYTTTEAAALLGKAEFTVREWCRLRRIRAEKRPCGRGRSHEWMISRADLQRYRNEPASEWLLTYCVPPPAVRKEPCSA